MDLNNIPIEQILLVLYGGIFGWVLCKLPKHWVYGILAISIILTILFVVK